MGGLGINNLLDSALASIGILDNVLVVNRYIGHSFSHRIDRYTSVTSKITTDPFTHQSVIVLISDRFWSLSDRFLVTISDFSSSEWIYKT